MISPKISDENESAKDSDLPPTYSFGLKNDLSELTVLRQHVENFGQMAGLSQNCLFEIILCLDELFTNIISYGFEDGYEHQIKFNLSKVGETLVVEVEDDGRVEPRHLPLAPLRFEPITIDVGDGELFIGSVITALVTFLIVAFVCFLIVKAYNAMKAPADEDDAPSEIDLLIEIRDELRSRGS